MKRSSLKSWGFALIFSFVFAVGVLLAFDRYVHHRVRKNGGLNWRGYRGEVLSKKKPNEVRLAVMGGSTAFGFGVEPHESISYYLEQKLNEAAKANKQNTLYSVANLGLNSQGVYSFPHLFEDYENLDIDIAIFYNGYNDLSATWCNRTYRDSAIFRWTGYYPIFPLVFQEKANVLRFGKGHEKLSEEEKIRFEVPKTKEVIADSVEVVAKLGSGLEEYLSQLQKMSPQQEDAEIRELKEVGKACSEWAIYCGSYDRALQAGLFRGIRVLSVEQPRMMGIHGEQQSALKKNILPAYLENPKFKRVNLGRALSVNDKTMSFDRMHLTPAGNARIAELLVAPVLQWTERPQYSR